MESAISLGDQFLQQPHVILAQLREWSPVPLVRFPDGEEGRLVTRYGDVKMVTFDPRIGRDLDVIEEVERARAARHLGPRAGDETQVDYGWMLRSLLYMDPPDHTRLRKLVSKAFTPRAIEQLRPRIEAIAGGLLDRMAGAAPVDLVAEFAVPLPMTAISELLGVPDEDRPDFWAWSHVLNSSSPDADRPAAFRVAADYLDALAERKRSNPGNDLMSHMVMASEDRDQLSRKEVIAMALLMLLAGHDTTANLIANGVLAFLSNPGQLDLLRADPALLPNAVEEILRYDCPVNISTVRYTLEPIELSGVRIPAGELLYISVLSANRDARQYDAPDTFDINRSTDGHLGMGHGIHYCLGAPLARMEGQIALGQLFERFPRLRLAAAPETLTYRASTLMHGPTSLPVLLQ
jgi:cytochrome P450